MNLSSRVKKALESNSNCRDNDSTLCAFIWDEDCKNIGEDFKSISAIQFLHLVDTGKISKQQSILRSRRNINNKNYVTRGKSYKPRTSKRLNKKHNNGYESMPIDVNGDIDANILCSHKELLSIHESIHFLWFRTRRFHRNSMLSHSN
jgi:hypothetical protein